MSFRDAAYAARPDIHSQSSGTDRREPAHCKGCGKPNTHMIDRECINCIWNNWREAVLKIRRMEDSFAKG